MSMFSPLRRGFDTVVTQPVKRPLYLLGGIGTAAKDIFRATRRGAKRNRLSTPPIEVDMNSHQVQRLDQWWQSLPVANREQLLSHYDTWVVEQSILAERQIELGRGSKRNYWSLSGSRKHRKEALKTSRGTYLLWLSLLGAGIIGITVIYLIRDVTPMFFLMSAMFLGLIVPDVMRQRLARAQLLYGRRVSLRDFCKPLPTRMHIDEAHEAMYQSALKSVMSGKAQASNPVANRFYNEVYGHELIEGEAAHEKA